MTNTKTTKRALLASALALFVCVSMLIGSTFAWFTDNASATGNIIQSGKLDVTLEMKDANGEWADAEGEQLEWITEDDVDNVLWEPGCTYRLPELKVENKGNLALKYEVIITGITGDAKLLEVITFTGIPTGVAHLKPGEFNTFTIEGHMDEAANNDYQELTVENISITVKATQDTVEADSYDNQYDAAAGTGFVGGAGTEADPYIIDAPAQLLSISENYDEYKYYKIADGVDTLDMTGLGRISLNGSFDGNGVEIVNLSTSLFKQVGDIDNPSEIKISNMDVSVNTTDGHALVRNIYNAGETIFENVELHGYIEGQYNVGSFYNYGTANHGDSEGADYTVSFINTTSDATLVCTTGNVIGGMLGHGYEGSNYKLSINMDATSGYTGEMYTNASVCYAVMGMCSHATYTLNGVEVSRYDNTYAHNPISIAAPTAGADGYYVAPVSGAEKYVVYLNSQLTAYDENDIKIDNKAGLTWNLGKETITSGFDGKIFDLVSSAQIVNSSSKELGYELDNGNLTVYSGKDDNYVSGWVTLQVNQYAADGSLLATGIVTVHTFPEP